MIGEGLPQFLMDGEDIEGQEGGEWHFWTQPSNGIIVWLLIFIAVQTFPHVNISKSVKA